VVVAAPTLAAVAALVEVAAEASTAAAVVVDTAADTAKLHPQS
jgi:hypothetical protein